MKHTLDIIEYYEHQLQALSLDALKYVHQQAPVKEKEFDEKMQGYEQRARYYYDKLQDIDKYATEGSYDVVEFVIRLKKAVITEIRPAYLLENPEAPLSAQHEAWLKNKQEEGWAHGPIKD